MQIEFLINKVQLAIKLCTYSFLLKIIQILGKNKKIQSLISIFNKNPLLYLTFDLRSN